MMTVGRKAKLALAMVFFLCGAARAATPLSKTLSWSELKAQGKLLGGEVVLHPGESPQEELKLENPQDQPATITICVIDKPVAAAQGPEALQWQFDGQVRYDGVQGKAYLEMWSYFADGGAFFSRTLGESGPSRHLEGTSGWRPFLLPFAGNAELGAPDKLELNVVMPGRGTVYLAPVYLRFNGGGVAAPWWSERTGGIVGGVFGGLLGASGTVLGLLVRRGKGRAFVFAMLWGILAVGAVLLPLGIYAVARSQPYGVYYPLLVVGVLGTVLPLSFLRQARRSYEQIELRKMTSMDAR